MEQTNNTRAYRERETAKNRVYEKIRDTSYPEQTEANTIKDAYEHFKTTYGKVDRFNYNWHSLGTSEPLLFEDIDYARTSKRVDNKITPQELEAYRSGKLREIYPTYEAMLMDNIHYFDRIVQFTNMITCQHHRLNDDELTDQHIKGTVPMHIAPTPTYIWCAAMTNMDSTEWELSYAWNGGRPIDFGSNTEKLPLEKVFQSLAKNKTFQTFATYRSWWHKQYSGLHETPSYRDIWKCERMTNDRLSIAMQKFTYTTAAMSEHQIGEIYKYALESERMTKALYDSLHTCMMEMFDGDFTQFAIYVYMNEFIIYTSKFSLRVEKTKNGTINQEFLANHLECFAAQEYLLPSIKDQIEWAKYDLPANHNYEKKVLEILMLDQLERDHKNVVAIKRMEFGVTSKIYFTGIFKNVYVIEEYYKDNQIIKKPRKVCMSKKNAAKYVVDRGYYLCGTDDDLCTVVEVNKFNITAHYLKYTIPVMKSIRWIREAFFAEKLKLKKFLLDGIVPELNNSRIKYLEKPIGSFKSIMRRIGSEKAIKERNKLHKNRQAMGKPVDTYWGVVGQFNVSHSERPQRPRRR